jgi:hypothetical protein
LKDSSRFISNTLQHAFLTELGAAIVGRPCGPFATYDDERDELLVFGADQGSVVFTSLLTDSASVALEIAQKEGASFSVMNGIVQCKIGDVSAEGKSYAESAIRAFLTLRSRSPDF